MLERPKVEIYSEDKDVTVNTSSDISDNVPLTRTWHLILSLSLALRFWVVLERPNVEVSSENRGVTVNTTSDASDNIPLAYTNETFSEKLKWIPSLFKFMIPIGLVYFFEYFINQGLVSIMFTFFKILITIGQQC